MFQFGKLVQRLWRNFFQTIIWCPVAKIQATFGNTYLSKKPVRGPFRRCSPLSRRRVRAQVRSGSSRASCSYLPVDQFQTIDIYEREGRRGSITEPDPPLGRRKEANQVRGLPDLCPVSPHLGPDNPCRYPPHSSFALPFHWLLDELNWNLTRR